MIKRCALSFQEQLKLEKVHQLLTESLLSEEIHSKLETVLETQINHKSGINDVVSDFSNIIISAANKSLV